MIQFDVNNVNQKYYSRRSVLRLGSLGIVSSLPGCSAPAFIQGPGILIGDILIEHYPKKSHTVQVELERNGKTVKKVTYNNLQSDQKRIVKATWPSTPGVYRLYTIVEGPLTNTNEPFKLFVNKFTRKDVPAGVQNCSVVEIEIGPPPTPGEVAIGLKQPGPTGFGGCRTSK